MVESAPVLVLISPENRQSIVPGGALVLEEASYDADNDLTVREWRRYAPELSEPEVLSALEGRTHGPVARRIPSLALRGGCSWKFG